ncbi:MAG: hypothetical protein H7067_05255, partial [Burkholderiales bacterium]|nr:hypothetical protein [Opitutaceae bacterium]
TAAQTTVASNGVFRFDVTSGTASFVTIFDQTPTDTTAGTQSTFATDGVITASLAVRAVTTNSSFSVVFIDPANQANNLIAVFNIITGGNTVRFFKDGTLISGNVGTQVGTTNTQTTIATPNSGVFTTLTVALSVTGTTPTITVTPEGGTPVASTFAAGDFNFASAKTLVALRLNDAGNTSANTPVDLDDIVITSPTAPDNPPGPPEDNVAPVLPAQADRSVAALDTLLVNNTGSDANTPAQALSYELTAAPAGATISATGVITWTPSPAQVSGNPYTFTTVVTDSGTPALTATNTFGVTVTAAPVFAYTQSIPFNSASDFAANFRTISALGGGTFGVVNGALTVDARSSGGNTSAILLYDRTPDDTGHATQTAFPTDQQIRVSFLARAATTGSGFSVSFADPRNANNRVSAQFVLTTGNDIVRFFRDGTITATTASNGTQVGTDVAFDVGAEPASGTFVPVTVILTVNGTTPTLTVTAGGGSPVTSTFAAGDIDWTPSLVLLRFGDPSTAVGALELSNLLVAGGNPVAPAAPVLPPAPGPDGNLITVNPSFESGSLNNFSGSYSFTGWNGTNALFASHAISTGSVAAGTTTDGVKYLRQSWGGTLNTALTARPPATPGATYELTYDQRSLIRNFPSEKLGCTPTIEFFDAVGVRIKSAWNFAGRYRIQDSGINTWQTFTVRAVAPPGTAYVGLFFNNPSGRFASSGAGDFTQDRHVEMDNVRLKLAPEIADRLAYRRAPRLVEPGRTATVRLNHATQGARLLRASLLDSTGTERATAQVAVAAGRYHNTRLPVAIPANLTDGTYSWRLQLLPAIGGPAVATITVPGVLCDQSVAAPTAVNGTDFDADHPRIQFMGRIENTNPKQQWLHWFGSEVRVRFSGTSLALRGSMTDSGFGAAESTNVQVVIDEDFSSPLTVTLNSFNYVKSLVSGLPDGVHTARIFKANETDISIRIDGFRVDAGRGLLLPEPLPNRRIEIYGDSVTSGGTASPGFNGYAPLLGRELDADVHIVSKGGTGVAASFSSQDILVNYYDNLSFPNVFNASSTGSLPWDFNRWTADVVICAIGHNDQFNNGGATFNTRYAEFKNGIRAAYPNAKFITANTLISANLGQLQSATDPLMAVDPLHTFAFQPNTWSDSATGHPPTAGHAAQIYGDERRYSLAEVVEEQAGWGLDAAPSGFEDWAASAFTTEQLAAGDHAPEAEPFGDGIPNLLRYALGGAPGEPVALPSAALDPAGKLTLAFNRAEDDALYVVETSDDLATWQQAALNPGAVGGPVTWTDESPAGPRRFVRLRVVQP